MNTLHVSQRCWNALRLFSLRLCAVAGLGATLLISACSGGSSSMGSNSPPGSGNNGTAMITLTDLPGDLSTYLVNVTSLKLVKADGTTIETIPATTSVDFAKLVNLSEVLTARQVPAGAYTAASLTLDFTGAKIVVDNGGGGLTVQPTSIINGATKNPLVSPNNQMTLTLQLPNGQPLVVTQGTISNLALDFNLSASNSVTPSPITSSTAASAVMVTVNPVLTASLTPDLTKMTKVRGTLVSVTNTSTATSYTVKVRPFFSADDADDMGQVVVNTTPTTAFTINGTSYAGNAGLTALAAAGAGTLTAAFGTLDTQSMSFTALEVFAGTSVPGAGLDSIEGTVVARNGNVLTVMNGFLEPHGGGGVAGGEVMSAAAAAGTGSNMDMSDNSMGNMGNMGGNDQGDNQGNDQGNDGEDDGDFGHHHGKVAVTVASTTTVTKDGQTGTFGPQDISVGQHLQAFGKFGTDASGNRTLDATSGSVRLMLTRASGQFSSAASGVVTMSLQSLDGQQPSAFNFAGTGSGTGGANDATPGAYTVSVPPALTLPTLAAGDPVAFEGFVTPFGSAPPDFSAVTLVNPGTANARLHLAWNSPGVTAPFVTPLSPTNVMMTQTMVQSANEHVVQIGGVTEDPGSVTAGLSFVPNASGPLVFVIGHRMSWQFQVYTSFSDFITALNGDLNGTTALLQVAAQGPYNLTTGVMSANLMAVELSD